MCCDPGQENAAGALMHIDMSEEARSAMKDADVIPRLCELLAPTYEPEVNSQALDCVRNKWDFLLFFLGVSVTAFSFRFLVSSDAAVIK